MKTFENVTSIEQMEAETAKLKEMAVKLGTETWCLWARTTMKNRASRVRISESGSAVGLRTRLSTRTPESAITAISA